MPLPTPILDDRSFEQIFQELRAKIAVFNPAWTDHNDSDPGITLLQLFSFLGENLLFRFNQIPEATKLAFLKLLGIPMLPATPSEAMLALSVDTANPILVDAQRIALAGDIKFETRSEAQVWPVLARAAVRDLLAPPFDFDEQAYFDQSKRKAQLGSNEVAVGYRTRLATEDPNRPDPEGLLAPWSSIDRILWIAVVAADPLVERMKAGGTPLTLDGTLNIGFVPDEEVAGLAEITTPCPGGQLASGSKILFDYSTGLKDGDIPRYDLLGVAGDTTNALTKPGVVRLKMPEMPKLECSLTASLARRTFGETDPDLFGTRLMPPAIEDEELEEKILFWIRAYRPAGSELALPRVLYLGANSTEAVQSIQKGPELVGTGTGQPEQPLAVTEKPVIDKSMVLEVEDASGFAQWTEVENFDASRSSDRHYTVDREGGLVRFGNGVRGALPQIGERIRATRYRVGGGIAGNMPAKAISELEGVAGVSCENPLAASGGADNETIAAALDRVPGEVRRQHRAVTTSDFRELALMTPAAHLGRVEVLPRAIPADFHLTAAPIEGEVIPNRPGAVTVMVWPEEDRKHPNAPMPTRTTLRRVCAYLDERRLITTELWVVPPAYRKLAVSVGVVVKSGHPIEGVRRWVELLVRQFLAPLPPYGPEGQGWPLGRPVIARELEAAVVQVEGVQYLSGAIRLAYDNQNGATPNWVRDVERVPLHPWEVVELDKVLVVDGPPLDPLSVLTPADQNDPTGKKQVPIPVPKLKQEC